MKKLFYTFPLLALLLMTACEEEKQQETLPGGIYGIVSNMETGEPVEGASITLTPGNLTTVSEYDGYFEFSDIEAGQYKMEVSASGYVTKRQQITVVAGSIASGNVMLQQDAPEGLDVEAVDLGLSVKWAVWNMGASAPEEFGDYYCWGETETKEEYTEESYLYYKNGSFVNIGSNICGTRYDAAHVKWGGDWRLPTDVEAAELVNECSWETTSVNGVNGVLVTGPNGNSIFLPATGSKLGNEIYGTEGGDYLTGMLNKEDESIYVLTFDMEELYCLGYYSDAKYRYFGRSIRPVKDKK